MKLKYKLKSWLQKKMRSISDQHVADLTSRFAYVCRAERLSNCAQNCNSPGVSSDKYCDDEIVVSLTTHGSRLYDVYLAIESIMQQTFKPNKIVLWLADEMKGANIPMLLQNQQKRGLEIRYCNDIRAYKKLIPALTAFPSASIITIDDDNIYYPDLIENLVNEHKENADVILCARLHRIKLVAGNRLEKYARWIQLYDKFDISPLNFPTGIGGVLYPPGCFSNEVFNEAVFTDICKYADDVWFKAMALLNGTMSKKVFTHNKNGTDHFNIENTQYTALSQINIDKNMNDKQLKAVFDKYGLYDKLYRG